MSRSAIIIFAKQPSAGKVKTRLAKSTGDKFAVTLYRLVTEQLMNELRKFSEFKKYLFYTPDSDANTMRHWLGNEFIYIEQNGMDLGLRMQSAFELVLSEANDRVIIVGTDIPDLNSNVIVNAFSKLELHDVVIGPSADGGYYLLGMKKGIPEIFENIDWSTEKVFKSTIEKLDKLNHSYFILDELNDIDTEDDLNNWLSKSNPSCFREDIGSLYKSTIIQTKPLTEKK